MEGSESLSDKIKELEKEIGEIKDNNNFLNKRFSSEKEDEDDIMIDSKKFDVEYNRRINIILNEHSNWHNCELEIDELLDCLLKAKLQAYKEAQKIFRDFIKKLERKAFHVKVYEEKLKEVVLVDDIHEEAGDLI